MEQREKWILEYCKKEIINLNKHFTMKDLEIIRQLNIKIKNKNYTKSEFERLYIHFLECYQDNEQYNKLLQKIENIIKLYDI